MATYTQSERPLEITTPLGKDALLLTGFRGVEATSQLFRFELDLLAAVQVPIKFDKILGQAVTIRLDLTNGGKRYFNGIVSKFSQAGRNDKGFGKFRAEVVPLFWTLTRRVRSRTFQHMSVPEILRQVLVGFDVSYRLIGTYPPRDYCVQYRESDCNFASRLMEEEGIAYFFHHEKGLHTMIVSDHLNGLVEGQSAATYDEDEGAVASEMRVTKWEKTQILGPGEFTMWDHCFELPGNHLEAKKKLTDIVTAGTVQHKLRVGLNNDWEVYDYPGPYARRFDGMDSSGNPQPVGIDHIFEDRKRAIKIRMQQEETASIEIHGASYCGNFSPGYKFELKRHFDADGEYLLTRVEHEAVLEDYQTGEVPPFRYANRFECVPSVVHFRPQPVTPKPFIAGIQTATVVGPPGEEIFVDRYGRVKVQFHWDREGKMDANSSCWLRVSQFWAGKKWGAFFWPRIGNEVVVAFEEGDPDQPIVLGSVYNRENMPWFDLPLCKDFGGFKSVSVRGNAHEHYNGVIVVDRKGQEHLSIHSERHMTFNTEFDKMFQSGRHQAERVAGHRTVTVGGGIPGGGGSGGGPSPLWPTPEVQSVLGLNSAVVYGVNLQSAAPINIQLAVGSNLQLCFNPSALASLVQGGVPAPPATEFVAGMLGGGAGGNMQFTLGTSTSFVIGQTYDINLGPRRIVVDVHDTNLISKPTIALCWLLVAATLIFEIGYALAAAIWNTDDSRVILFAAYAVASQVLLTAMVAVQDLDNSMNQKQGTAYRGSYKTRTWKENGKEVSIPDPTEKADLYQVDSIFSSYSFFPVLWTLTLALALPAVLVSEGEIRLDESHSEQDKQQADQAAQDKAEQEEDAKDAKRLDALEGKKA